MTPNGQQARQEQQEQSRGRTDGAEPRRKRYVGTPAAHQLVKGRGPELMRLLGVAWPPLHGPQKINCPFPQHPDRNPSWRLSDDGERYFCTCGDGDVFDAIVGLGRAADFEEAKLVAAELLGRHDCIVDPKAGVTLADLAAHKGLPEEFLRSCGLMDGHHWRAQAVRIPYYAEDGTELDPRWRVSLSGDPKTVSEKGAKTALYGLHRRDDVLERGFVLAVEGETDALTLWLRGWPAIGLPGAGNFRDDRDAAWFDGIEAVYMVREPDQGGETMTKRLSRSRVAPRVRVIDLPVKDASALHLSDPDGFDMVLQAAIEAAAPLPLSDNNDNQTNDTPFNITFYRDLALDMEDNALVDGLMERRGFTAIIGPPGSGKTFFAINLSLSLSRGRQFFGRSVQKTPTLYIATEAGSAIIKRALAYADVPRETPFAVITTGINLREENSQNALNLIEAVGQVERNTGIKFGLVVIDTLSRAIPGADKSGSVDISNLIGNCDAIRAATEAGIILVHHVGKDATRGSRGSSLLPAAVDTEITLSVNTTTGIFTAKTSKQRELPCDGILTWQLETVELAQTNTGKPITTCRVVPVDGAEDTESATKKTLTKTERVVLDALRMALVEAGQPATDNRVPAGQNVVSASLWRRYHEQITPAEDQKATDSRSRAFRRAREGLQAAGVIGIWGELVWIV